jgi:hypothetical protein
MTVTLSNSTNEYDWRKRPPTDFYQTPKNVTKALLDFLNLEDCFLWDCACGDGLMCEVFGENGFPFLGTDIARGEDFLKTNELPLEENVWIITNPPFIAAEKFIRHAAKLKPKGFAFLLKSQYWHATTRLQLFNEIFPSYVLPLTWRPDFLFGKKSGSPTMEVLWTVWCKKKMERTCYIPLRKPER